MIAPNRPAVRALAFAWLQLLALWGLAVVVPLFQLFADSPDYLVAQDNGWPDVPLVSLLLVLGPPTAMLAVEALLRGRPAVAAWVHRAFLGVLFAALALQALKSEFDPTRRWLFYAALLAGAAFAFLHAKGRFLETLLAVLSPVPVAALVWFLAISPVSAIAWPVSDGPEVERTALSMPVVLVIFDELSAASISDRGRIDRRLPTLAALAGTSTWFPNATTMAAYTKRAVPAILAGRLPPGDDLPIASEHPPSLFDRVRGRFHVHEPITDLCSAGCDDGGWVANGRELAASMVDLTKARVRPGRSPEVLGLPPEAVERRAHDFETFNAGVVDGLNVLHVELPHVPYQYGPRGRYTKRWELPGLVDEQWTTDARLVQQAERRYLAQLRYTDGLVGGLVASLRRKGLWDRALVILTADHGVAFIPGRSRRAAQGETFGEVAGVPLFVKAPGQSRGRVEQAAVTTLDVLPTIGDFLGARWPLPGRSLRTPRSRDMVSVAPFEGPALEMPFGFYEALRDRASARLARAAADDGPLTVAAGSAGAGPR